MRRALILVALLMVGVAFFACKEASQPKPAKRGPALGPAPSGAPTVGLDIGQIAPEIDGHDLDLKRFKLSDFRGKVVLLDFWGHW
jgi:hypothetical protein